MSTLPKRPQLPQRLRCIECVSTEFGGALRTAMAAAPPSRKQSARGFVDGQSVAKYTGMQYKSPLACVELYREWVHPADDHFLKRGSLSHLSLETVARLAVDVFLDELHAWVALGGSLPPRQHLYQVKGDADVFVSAGFTLVNGKFAGSCVWLTEEEAQRFSAWLVSQSASVGAPAPVE